MRFKEDDELDLKIKFDRFAGQMHYELDEVKKFIKFMNLDSKDGKRLNGALDILTKKIKKIKKCTSLEEASKHVKLKKIDKDFESE